MLAKIKKVDLITNKDQTAQRRFYAYLACWKKQLVKVTVAVRTKYKRWQCKQVAVHFLNSKTSYVKDLIFYPIGGYQVGWYDLGLDKTEKFYEDGLWNLLIKTVNGEYKCKSENVREIAFYKTGVIL